MTERKIARQTELEPRDIKGSTIITNSEDWEKVGVELEKSLTDYLSRVLSNTPHYLDSVNFSVFSLENFDEIPLTTPEDLLRDPKSFIFDRERVVQIASSGGTYGARKIVYRTNEDLNNSVEATLEMFKIAGVKYGDVVAILQPFDLWNIGHIALNTFREMGILSIPVGLSSSDEEILEILRAEDATIVYGTPSKLASLAELSKKLKVDLQITKALSAGEPLLPQYRETIMSNWSAETFGIYGSEETDGMGVECQKHEGYHTFDKNLIVEVLDPESLTYANKPEGVIAVTKIGNEGTILVRYLLGDIVEINREECVCGIETTRVQPKGRLQETIWLYDGRKVRIKALDQLFHNFLGTLPQYQVVVFRERGHDKVRILIDANISSDLLNRLSRVVSRASQDLEEGVAKGEIKLEFDIIEFSQFYNTSRGKIPQIIYQERD